MDARIQQAQDELTALLRGQLTDLVDGAEADVQTFAAEIARNAAEAATIPDTDRRNAVLVELTGQLKNIAEINRLRVVNAGEVVFTRVIDIAIKAAVIGLTAVA